MGNIDRVLAMIKRLTVPELIELKKKLDAFPDWPGKEAAPVGAKPKSGPPTISAAAEAKIPKGADE